jgi:hypothetical protein
MLTNSDITIYKKGAIGYDRYLITGKDNKKGAFWDESAQSNMIKSGLSTIGTVNIMIPLLNMPDITLKTGVDIAVKGNISFTFDNTSLQSVASSMTQLKQIIPVFTIVTADKKDFGSPSMQHYQLSCK